jgi:hypothetical protein
VILSKALGHGGVVGIETCADAAVGTSTKTNSNIRGQRMEELSQVEGAAASNVRRQQGTIMPNTQRGEIAAVLDGEERTLCLTLGALAELEARLQAGDLVGLSERFASGRVSARDLTAIIGAGLRGGGNAVTDDDLARMAIEGGLKGAADIAARLLRATFGDA